MCVALWWFRFTCFLGVAAIVFLSLAVAIQFLLQVRLCVCVCVSLQFVCHLCAQSSLSLSLSLSLSVCVCVCVGHGRKPLVHRCSCLAARPVQTSQVYSTHTTTHHRHKHLPVSFIHQAGHVCRAFSLVIFAYSCQSNVPAIYCELENQNCRRMVKVSRRSTFLCFITYALMGVCGFLSWGDGTGSNIMQNYAATIGRKWAERVCGWVWVRISFSLWVRVWGCWLWCVCLGFSVMMALAFAGMAFAVTFAYPMNIFPCRYSIVRHTHTEVHTMTHACVCVSSGNGAVLQPAPADLTHCVDDHRI